MPRSSSGRTEDARQLWSGGAATAAIAALIALAGILVCRWLFGSGVERQVDMAEVNGRGAPDTFRCDRREGPACRMAPLEQRAYLVLMPPTARSMYAATYVRDIDTSRAFYELLGFRELRAGRAATSAWSALQHHTLFVLLTSTRPPLEIPPLPLLFYFFYDDVEAVAGALAAAGVRITRTGHPPHALGGEVKVLDPDGNTILLGTREPSAAEPMLVDDETSIRFSLLREAAALAAARGETNRPCRVRDLDGGPCPSQAVVKLADSLGDKAWVCLAHADEILVAAPEVFIASHQGRGLAAFLSHRR